MLRSYSSSEVPWFVGSLTVARETCALVRPKLPNVIAPSLLADTHCPLTYKLTHPTMSSPIYLPPPGLFQKRRSRRVSIRRSYLVKIMGSKLAENSCVSGSDSGSDSPPPVGDDSSNHSNSQTGNSIRCEYLRPTISRVSALLNPYFSWVHSEQSGNNISSRRDDAAAGIAF